MSPQKPPLSERESKVMSISRAVVRQEQKVRAVRLKLAEAEVELRSQRRLFRELMADDTTLGPDGENQGTLP